MRTISDNERIARAAHHAQLLADALNVLPRGIPVPTHTSVYTHGLSNGPKIGWLLFGSADLDLDEQKRIAVEVIRALGGKWDKQPRELFSFRTVRGGVEYSVTVDREAVCQRVVTGTREVVKTVPAPDAPMVEVTETVEEIEWVCEPVLEGTAS